VVDLLLASEFPMVALWGPELVQIYNDGYRGIMAGKHPEGLGQPTRECWPEVWHINEPIYERVGAGETLTFEDKLFPITRHGYLEDAWFKLSYSPLRDEGGGIAGVLVTVFETTERHRAEAAREEAERRMKEVAGVAGLSSDFRALFEAAPTPFLVLAPDLRIFAVNDAYLRATMTRREAILGRTFFEVFPDDPNGTGVRNLRASLDRVLATRRTDIMAAQRYPTRRPAKASGGFEERWWSPINRPVRGTNREVAGIIHRVEDVTEIVRLRSESEAQDQIARDQQALIDRLRESEQRFRLMADAVPQIVWIIDVEGRVEFFNWQWSDYTGVPYEPTTAAEVAANFVHPDDAALTMERFEEARRTGGTFLVEHRIRSKDGDYRWCGVSPTMIRPPPRLPAGSAPRWTSTIVSSPRRRCARARSNLGSP
jgi:PAS domain S-box-containing protein